MTTRRIALDRNARNAWSHTSVSARWFGSRRRIRAQSTATFPSPKIAGWILICWIHSRAVEDPSPRRRGRTLNHPTNSRAEHAGERLARDVERPGSPSHPYANIVPSYLGREKKVREDAEGRFGGGPPRDVRSRTRTRGVYLGDELGDGDVAAELDVAEEADSRVGENAVEAVRHGLGARVVGRDAGSDEPEGGGQALEHVHVRGVAVVREEPVRGVHPRGTGTDDAEGARRRRAVRSTRRRRRPRGRRGVRRGERPRGRRARASRRRRGARRDPSEDARRTGLPRRRRRALTPLVAQPSSPWTKRRARAGSNASSKAETTRARGCNVALRWSSAKNRSPAIDQVAAAAVVDPCNWPENTWQIPLRVCICDLGADRSNISPPSGEIRDLATTDHGAEVEVKLSPRTRRASRRARRAELLASGDRRHLACIAPERQRAARWRRPPSPITRRRRLTHDETAAGHESHDIAYEALYFLFLALVLGAGSRARRAWLPPAVHRRSALRRARARLPVRARRPRAPQQLAGHLGHRPAHHAAVSSPRSASSPPFSLEWHTFRRCASQVLWLAGPGVIMGTFLMGALLKVTLPYEWGWGVPHARVHPQRHGPRRRWSPCSRRWAPANDSDTSSRANPSSTTAPPSWSSRS